jgi:hypothetical protein
MFVLCPLMPIGRAFRFFWPIHARKTANAGEFPFNIPFQNLSEKAITQRNTLACYFEQIVQ